MEPEKKVSGVTIGLIVIIIILIVVGLYMWNSNKEAVVEDTAQSESVTTENSSELDALQQDLESTNIDIEANAIGSVQ